MEELDIKIQYDGEYPSLCMGHLIVWINGKKWDFGNYVLESGGHLTYEDGRVVKGEWSIPDNCWDNCWPEGFPEKYKKQVLSKINQEIPHGCCGGCL